jgi:hypothetical protein
MREISNYKLQIPNKLQKANYKYLVIEICDLPSKNIKMLTIYAKPDGYEHHPRACLFQPQSHPPT